MKKPAATKKPLVIEANWADKHRPRLFKEFTGQEDAVNQISGMLKRGSIPQTILIVAPSGAGKSTLARLIARRLSPDGHDIFESNASEDTGIDKMRSLIESAQTRPMHGDFKVFILDEIHGLTRQAGSASLSFLEKPPNHVVVIGTTNEEERMLTTLRDRATILRLKPLSSQAIYTILRRIAEKENVFQPPEEHDVVFKILAKSLTGSARPAIDALYKLSLIHAVRPLNKEDLTSEVNQAIRFDYRDVVKFVTLWYAGQGPEAMKIIGGVEDAVSFSSLLCNIHAYLLQRAVGMNPPFDYLGNMAGKGLSKVSPEILRDNLEVCLTLRSKVINPMGCNPFHILLTQIMSLKEK